MAKEKEATAPVRRTGITFVDYKKRTDSLDNYFVDSEPSNRVKATSDGTHNKADISFEQLVSNDVMPNRKNAGLKPQTNRRYR